MQEKQIDSTPSLSFHLQHTLENNNEKIQRIALPKIAISLIHLFFSLLSNLHSQEYITGLAIRLYTKYSLSPIRSNYCETRIARDNKIISKNTPHTNFIHKKPHKDTILKLLEKQRFFYFPHMLILGMKYGKNQVLLLNNVASTQRHGYWSDARGSPVSSRPIFLIIIGGIFGENLISRRT